MHTAHIEILMGFSVLGSKVILCVDILKLKICILYFRILGMFLLLFVLLLVLVGSLIGMSVI